MTTMSKLAAVTLATLGVALFSTTAFADRGETMGQAGGRGNFAAFDFAAVDANKDGKITPDEIAAFRAAEAKAADTDGDGLMSAEELAVLHTKALQTRAAEMATRMIERQDSDGDGKLSGAEMTVRPMGERMFERLDTDKDGALSEAELAAAKERMADRRGGAHGEGRGHGKHRGHDTN